MTVCILCLTQEGFIMCIIKTDTIMQFHRRVIPEHYIKSLQGFRHLCIPVLLLATLISYYLHLCFAYSVYSAASTHKCTVETTVKGKGLLKFVASFY